MFSVLIILGRLKEEKMTSPLLVDLADVNKAMALCKDMPDIQSALKLMLPQPVNSAESSGSGSGSGEGGYSAGSGKCYLILIPKDQFYTYFFVLRNFCNVLIYVAVVLKQNIAKMNIVFPRIVSAETILF